MKHFYLFFFALSISNWSFTQNEWNNWVFPEDHMYDFAGGSPPTATAGGALTAQRGNATISDTAGDLLFYTDGESIWDRDHNLMPNGTGLNGCNQSSQSSIIVKKPGETEIYYVFTVDCRENAFANGIQYSEVDMTLNAGLGDVTGVKNVVMQTNVAEFVTVTLAPSGYWIIAHGSSDDSWYAFSFTCEGISAPVISNEGWSFPGVAVTSEEEGQLKASPDGTLLAYTYYIDFGLGTGRAELLEFDPISGIVSNAQTLDTFGQDTWGCEFSGSGEVLYIGYLYSGSYFPCNVEPFWEQNFISQHDISDLLAIPPADTIFGSNCFSDNIGQFQRGPDGRIYASLLGGASLMFYIESPDILGSDCNLVDTVSTGLDTPIMFCYPNFAPIPAAPITCGLNIILPSDTICEGECHDLIAEVSAGTGPFTFEWSPGIVETIDSVNVCPAVTTSYQVIVIDALGETDTTTATITIIPVPILNLGLDTALCEGTALLLDAENFGASYLWQDGSTDQTYTVSTNGIFWVEVDNGGCSIIDSIEVNFFGPLVDLGADSSLCSIAGYLLDAENTGSTYLWQDGSTEQTYVVSDTGTYTVIVTEPTSGCVVHDTIIISAGTMSVDLGPDTTLCTSIDLLLDAGNPGATYIWSDGSNDQTLTASFGGIYWVEVSEGFCEGMDSIEVTLQNLEADFTADDFVGCAPEAVSFFDLSDVPGGIDSWSWSFGDGGSSSMQNPSHTYTSSGIYNVNLVITSPEGCTSDTTKIITIEIYPSPLAAFTFSPDDPIMGETVDFNNTSIDALTWLWDFGDGNGSTSENPSHSYDNRGNYTVSLVVNNEICYDSVQVTIIIDEPIIFYVPNVFTPDGDNFNEIFQPVFTAGFDPYDFHLVIFNRWGELLFESFNASAGWNGTYGNQGIVQDGVYVWQIQFGDINSDEKYTYTGHITVLK